METAEIFELESKFKCPEGRTNRCYECEKVYECEYVKNRDVGGPGHGGVIEMYCPCGYRETFAPIEVPPRSNVKYVKVRCPFCGKSVFDTNPSYIPSHFSFNCIASIPSNDAEHFSLSRSLWCGNDPILHRLSKLERDITEIKLNVEIIKERIKNK